MIGRETVKVVAAVFLNKGDGCGSLMMEALKVLKLLWQCTIYDNGSSDGIKITLPMDYL